jgi:ABC-type transport system involved in multi-copper enzyme maturation permease subunit
VIWTIAKKEFLEKIFDFRVTISFVIAIILATVVSVVVGDEYATQKAKYDAMVAEAQGIGKEIKVYSQFRSEVVLPPSPLCVFSKGIDLPTPLAVPISPQRVPKYDVSLAVENPLMKVFDSLDLVTVFRILFALLAILLTFDTISGEKELGTLRLLLSSQVSRRQMLVGKAAGSIMVLAAVATVTTAFGLLTVQAFANLLFSFHQFVQASLFLVTTILYLTIFAMIGTFTSVICQRSSTSLVLALFAWFFIAVVQPEINTFLASELSPVSKLEEIQSALDQPSQAVYEEFGRLEKENASFLNDPTGYKKRFRGVHLQTGVGSAKIYPVVTDGDFPFLEYLIKQVALQRKLVDAASEEWRIYHHLYIEPLDKQLAIRRSLDNFSPAALYRRAASLFSSTDIVHYEGFFDNARKYRNECVAYLDEKGVFTSNAQLYFSRLNKADVNPVDTERRVAQYQADKNSIPWVEQQSPLDLRDAPVFRASTMSILTLIERAGSTFALMLLYLLLMAALTFHYVEKYDIR